MGCFEWVLGRKSVVYISRIIIYGDRVCGRARNVGESRALSGNMKICLISR